MMRVEELVKYKAYHELSVEELDLIKDMVSNEEEFNQLKQFLSLTELHFEENKIEASEAMHTQFLSELYPIADQRTSWWLPFFSFFFPSDKSWYQYPALQFAGLLLILFGLFNLFESPLKKQELAVNSKVEQTEEINLPVTIHKDTVEDIVVNKNEPKPFIEAEAEVAFDATLSNSKGKMKVEQLPSPAPAMNNLVTVAPEININEQSLDMLEDDLIVVSKSLTDKDKEIVQEEVSSRIVQNADYNAVTTAEAEKNQLTKTYNNSNISTNLDVVILEKSNKKRDKFQKESKQQALVFRVKDILGLSGLFYEVK